MTDGRPAARADDARVCTGIRFGAPSRDRAGLRPRDGGADPERAGEKGVCECRVEARSSSTPPG